MKKKSITLILSILLLLQIFLQPFKVLSEEFSDNKPMVDLSGETEETLNQLQNQIEDQKQNQVDSSPLEQNPEFNDNPNVVYMDDYPETTDMPDTPDTFPADSNPVDSNLIDSHELPESLPNSENIQGTSAEQPPLNPLPNSQDVQAVNQDLELSNPEIPQPVFAPQSGIEEGNLLLEEITDPNTQEITYMVKGLSEAGRELQLKDELKNIEIPDEINGIPVTDIGPEAFFQVGLESLSLGKNIEIIKEKAFAANKIGQLLLPDSVKFIAEEAFRDNQITSLNSNQVETIREKAFTNNGMKELSFGNGIKYIGEEAFSYNNLGENGAIVIPETVEDYGEFVFIYNNRYVLLESENSLVKTEKYASAGEFGQVVNPVTITIHFIDEVTEETILNDIEIGTNFQDPDGVIIINKPNRYKAEEINGYTVKEATDGSETYEVNTDGYIIYTPTDENYELTIKYKNNQILPVIKLKEGAKPFIDIDGDGSKDALLAMVEAHDLDGEDISDQITVNPESVSTNVDGEKHKVIYQVKDKYGNTGSKEITIMIGIDWFDFPLGNDWVLGDFTYDDNKVTGFSETGIEKVKQNKNLVLPHINPNDGSTVIDTVAEITEDEKSFRSKGLETLIDYGSLEGDKSGNIKHIEGRYGPRGADRSKGEFASNSLTNVTLNTLEIAGAMSFMNNSLSSLNFPNLREIGAQAFSGNNIQKINEEDLPKVEKIGETSFSNNEALTKVHMPQLKIAGTAAFLFSNNVSDIYLPELEVVEANAFADANLTEVSTNNFPKLKIINEGAFRGNKNLKLVEIPSVVRINDAGGWGNGPFENASPDVVLKDDLKNLEYIGAKGLKGLNIESLNIPKLQHIDPSAFGNNPGFKNTEGDENKKDWVGKVVIWADQDLPDRANYLVNPDKDFNSDDDWNEHDFIWDVNNEHRVLKLSKQGEEKLSKRDGKMVIPNRAQIVAAGAFEKVGVKEVYARDVEKIEDSGFWGNPLTDISDSFPQLKEVESFGLGANNISRLDLPELETIHEYAFWGTGELKDINLLKAKTVGQKAFFHSPVESIQMPVVKEIGERTFQNHKLTQLNLPEVEVIGVAAFSDPNTSNPYAKENGYPEEDFNNSYKKRPLQSIDLPKVQVIHDFAFAGNEINSINIPSVKQIMRRAFDDNKIYSESTEGTPPVSLPQVEEIGYKAFAVSKFRDLRVSDKLMILDNDAFAGHSPENKIFIYDFSDPKLPKPLDNNPNGLKDGYSNNNVRTHVVNPTHVTVRYIDEDGKLMEGTPVISEYILKDKSYDALIFYEYKLSKVMLNGELWKGEGNLVEVLEKERRPQTIDFIYEKEEYKNTAGVEIRQSNELDRNTGTPKVNYYFGEIMTTRVYLDVTDSTHNIYNDGEIRLYYDSKYLTPIDVKAKTVTSVKDDKISMGSGVIRIPLNKIEGGYSVDLPIEWKFNKYVTPYNYKSFIKAVFLNNDEQLSIAEPIYLSGYYGSTSMTKSSPVNLPDLNKVMQASDDGPRNMGALVEYIKPDGTRDYKVGDPSPVRYNFSVSNLERYVDKAIITDTIPTYMAVAEDGSLVERTAVFDKTLNPAWTYDEEKKLVTQSLGFEKTLNPSAVWEPLYLSYPDLQAGYNVKNEAKIELFPFEQSAEEESMKLSDDLTIYTGFYAPIVYEGDPRFEKFNAGRPHFDGLNAYFYDFPEERSATIPFLLRVSSMAKETDLRDVTLTDYGLDKRLYYYGVSFPRDSHTAGNQEVRIAAFKKAGENMNPQADNLLFDQSIVMSRNNSVIFPEEIAKDIDYVQIILNPDHKVFSALEFHVNTKLRDPDTPIFDEQGNVDSNIFQNYAVMSSNLYRKGTLEPASERGTLEGPNGRLVSKYSDEWDNLQGNYLWGEHAQVQVRTFKQQIGIKKTQTYPSTNERIVYPGESGDYVIGLTRSKEIPYGYKEDIKNFKMIDLMPKGVEHTQVILSSGFLRSGGTWREEADYEDTGRVAIIFEANKLLTGVGNIAVIKTKVSPMADTGTVENEVFADFDTEIEKIGNEKELGGKNYLYDMTSFRFDKPHELYARKFIRKAGELAWHDDGIITESEGEFQYRLLLINNLADGNPSRESIDIVDFFPYVDDVNIQEENIGNAKRPPRGSEFANKLDLIKGVVVPKGYTVTYWNSDTNIDYKGQSADDIIANLTWSNSPDENTKAIRVTADSGKMLDTGESLEIIINMIAPKNDTSNKYVLTGKKAYNSFVRKDNRTIRFIEPNTVYNTLPSPLGSISFTKFAQDQLAAEGAVQKAIAGAEFKLSGTTELGEEVIKFATSDENGLVEFKDVPILVNKENYTIKEVKVPETNDNQGDYRLSEKTYEVSYQDFEHQEDNNFAIKLSDEDSKEKFLNKRPIIGSLSIEKVAQNGDQFVALPYVKFSLIGKTVEGENYSKIFYTSTNGTATISGLIEGTYTLTEILDESKTGYIPIEPIKFTIDKNQKDYAFTDDKPLINEKVKLVINKLGLKPDEKVEDIDPATLTDFGYMKVNGYEFEIQEVNPTTKEAVAGGKPVKTAKTINGYVLVEDLKIGALYMITEVKKNEPDKYIHNNKAYYFTINEKGWICDESGKPFKQNLFNFPNEQKKIKGRVEIVKLDDDKKPLEGAVFGLYQNDELKHKAESIITDGVAKAVFENLTPGNYTLKEISAPPGYTHSLVEHSFLIPYELTNQMYLEPDKYGLSIQDDVILKEFKYEYTNNKFDIRVIKIDTQHSNLKKSAAEAIVQKGSSLKLRAKGPDIFDVYKPLSGVEFELFEISENNQKNSKGKFKTDHEGILVFENFSFAENKAYELIETATLDNYRLDGSPISINLSDEIKKSDFTGEIVKYVNNWPAKGRIVITKYDEDKKTTLAGAEFVLKDENGKVKNQTSDSNGMIEFRDLPLNAKYFVEELKAPEGYQLMEETQEITLTDDVSSIGLFVNNPPWVEFEIEKVWIGDKQAQAKVKIYAQKENATGDLIKELAKDKDGKEIAEIILNEQNRWKVKIENLPKYAKKDETKPLNAKNTQKIIYSIEEEEIEGYNTVITGSADYDIRKYTVTNSRTKSIGVTKHWEGKKLSEIKVILQVNGKDTDQFIILNDDNKWQHTFTNLPDKDGDTELKYSVREEVPEGYIVTYTGSEEEGFVITNKETPAEVSVPVRKVWLGEKLNEVEIKLFADGSDTGRRLVLNEGNDWQGFFENLPAANGDKEIVYTVEELVPEGYKAELSGNAQDGFIIRNSELPPDTPKIDIPVKKVWQGPALDKVIVFLIAEGETVVRTAVLNHSNNWSYVFTDLPETDGFRVIEYSISELVPKGYSVRYQGSASSGFVITNTKDVPPPPETPSTKKETPPTTIKPPTVKYPEPVEKLITSIPRTSDGKLQSFTKGLALLGLAAVAIVVRKKIR